MYKKELLDAAMQVEEMVERGELDMFELEAFAANWRKENNYEN
tara:strand:- start:1034 stop:1162 length:129 start_codon:yes stop_codon:yes gene_type:complete